MSESIRFAFWLLSIIMQSSKGRATYLYVAGRTGKIGAKTIMNQMDDIGIII